MTQMGSKSEACIVQVSNRVFDRGMSMNQKEEVKQRLGIRANHKQVSESMRLSIKKISQCRAQHFFYLNERKQAVAT